jgi:hypothetical protein
MTNPAIAYMSWGSWVADCPNPECTNAKSLQREQTQYHCWANGRPGACGTFADIQWPSDPDPDTVETALSGRSESRRSWRPGDEL